MPDEGSHIVAREGNTRCGTSSVARLGGFSMNASVRHTVGQESPDDIAGLCWDCHQARHRDLNGDFWRDPQEQEAYWFTFCEELQRA